MNPAAQSNTQPAATESRGPVVLQVLPALEAGGVERGTVQIARGLAAAGWTALVASSGGPMTHELDRAGGRHIDCELATKSPLKIRRNADRLAEIIEAHGVDLVHARSRAPAWSALYAARRTGRPFVTTFHSPYGDGLFKHWYNAVMAKGDAVIAISEFVYDHVRRNYGVEDDRLVMIHRGIDVDLFDPNSVSAERMIQLANAWRLPDGGPVVMLPGRLTRWKGQAVLIEALAMLDRDDVTCILVGADQGRERYRQELEDLAEKRGVRGMVRILDHCRDMSAAYMLADVVVSASIEPEGFGRVSAEAQAMGRPVIATDNGASEEIIQEGRTGWLIPPRDPAALARALEAALALDNEWREHMAGVARMNICNNFTVELMCARTLAVYESVLRT